MRCDILRAGQPVIAVLDEGPHHVAGPEFVGKIERMGPRHVGVEAAVEDADGNVERDLGIEDVPVPAFLESASS
jgi:hypothetical protein